MSIVFKSVLAVLSTISLLGFAVTFVEIRKLRRTQPAILEAVGIDDVDGGIRFLRGLLRLGFGRQGAALSARAKWAMRAYVFTYLWLGVLLVYTAIERNWI